MSNYGAFSITPHLKGVYQRFGRQESTAVVIIGYVEDDDARSWVAVDEDGRGRVLDIDDVTFHTHDLELQAAY